MSIEYEPLMNVILGIYRRYSATSGTQQFPSRIGTRARGPAAARVLAAKEWVSGGIAARNHRLVQAGKPPASSNHPAGGTGEITPEYTESGADLCVQDVDCEWIIREGKVICSRILRAERDSAARKCHEEKWTVVQAANLGVTGNRSGLCHPFRVAIFLLRLPGVARGATLATRMASLQDALWQKCQNGRHRVLVSFRKILEASC